MAIDLSQLNVSTPTTSGFQVPSLEKDMFYNLEKAAPTTTEFHVGLQWDAGDNYDLDLISFSLHANHKIQENDDFLYYDKVLTGPGLQKSGDNRTGAGDGDDEWLKVKIADVKPTVDRIVLLVDIYKAQERRQSFGMVKNALIHIDDAATGQRIAEFRLTDDYSTDTSVIFGELVRATDGWTFHAIGEGSTKTLQDHLNSFM